MEPQEVHDQTDQTELETKAIQNNPMATPIYYKLRGSKIF